VNVADKQQVQNLVVTGGPTTKAQVDGPSRRR
jgi:hypothetical protein